MSCEGVWSVEIKGPYGWERIATAFMEDGKYLGASASHYSVGRYKEDGDNLEISIATTQFADVRTIFGTKYADKLQITYRCEIKKNKITGKGRAKGIKKHEILVRFTRLDGLK
jgi:hypothetical protein